MRKYLTAQQTLIGPQILPIKKISIYSPEEWEEFIEEWVDLKKNQYIEIERLGGAGDMGIDIAAYIDNYKKNKNYRWDCYQCKHYHNSLSPVHVWKEFGKILYYTYIKEFPIPERYFFVAPKGVGTKLSNLLKDPDKLKQGIIDNWDQYCKNQITDTKEIQLVDNFFNYFNTFDFSIFDKIPPKQIIEEHKSHINHIHRFGGGLPERERLEDIPVEILKKENRYIKQLILAYDSDNSSTTIKEIKELKQISKYDNHFRRAREGFHNSEQLRNFSRDNLGPGAYDDFQEEIYNCVVDITEDENITNGFIRVKEVEKEARRVIIDSNPLKEVSTTIDRRGVCHQLANDGKLTWVEDE